MLTKIEKISYRFVSPAWKQSDELTHLEVGDTYQATDGTYYTILTQERETIEEDGMSFGLSDDSGEIVRGTARLATEAELQPLRAEKIAAEAAITERQEKDRQERLLKEQEREKLKREREEEDREFRRFLAGESCDRLWSGYDLGSCTYASDSPAKLYPDQYQWTNVGNGVGFYCNSEDLEVLYEFLRSSEVDTQQTIQERLTIYRECAGHQYYEWLLAKGYAELRLPNPEELNNKIGDPQYKGSKYVVNGYKVQKIGREFVDLDISWDGKYWVFRDDSLVPVNAQIVPVFEKADYNAKP